MPSEIQNVNKDIAILLADDYAHSREITKRILKRNGYSNITDVKNGEDAVISAKKTNYDLILMDMQMPVMSGFEATSKIRKLQGYKNTPIIALSSFTMRDDLEKCIEVGCTEYLRQPIDSKELMEKVYKHAPVKEAGN